jgi:HK97 family phage major capsid protein
VTSTLADTRDKFEAATKALRELTEKNDEITSSLDIAGGTFSLNEAQTAEFTDNLGKARELRKTREALGEQLGFKQDLSLPTGFSAGDAAAAYAAMVSGASGGKQKDLIGGLFEDPSFKRMVAEGGSKMDGKYAMHGVPDIARAVQAQKGRKDVYGSLPAGPGDLANFGAVQRDEFVTRAHRRMRVRDLFPVQTTTASLIEFFKVTGLTNNASVVPQRAAGAFGIKPQSTLSFTGVAASVRTIAHWEVAHRNVLADQPQLQGIIENELLYGLQLHEDFQILSGTGTGEDLLGVLNTSGIQTYARTSGPASDNMADALRRAATRVVLAFYEPTGIAMHPSDWEAIQLSKNTQNSYLFPVTLDLAGSTVLWNLPVVPTPAMAQGTAVIGAFGSAVQLYDREESNIRIADQHAGLFIQNAVVVLAEERLALATKRPEALVKVTL